MSLSANVNFYFQLTKSGAGVTGKAASITATIKKVTRGSSPTITTVTTSGGVVVGSVSEVDATNNKGAYVIGVTGLDPSADYLAGAHYTGTSTDVDNVDLPSYQAEFSLSISAGAIPQVQSDADGGLPTIRTVSKIVHGTKCWYVQTSANGGSDSNAGTAAAPFLTLAHACSAAAAGDTILVGGGSFSEVDFTVPANARLIGAGMGVTIVTSTSNNDTICRVSSGSMVSDMTIKGTAGSGIFQYAVGDNGATVTDVLIVRISGGTDSDFKYFTGTGSTYRAIECEGTGHWDESYEGGTGIIGEEWRCTYRSTGPNTEAANNGSVITVGGQNNVLRLFDPKIIYTDTASNTSRTVEAVRAIDGGNANANNRIEIYRGSISTNVPDGTIRHFRADDGCTVTVQDTSFDPSKVAQHFAIYGGPTGGTYSITVANYAGSQTAAGIAYNANDATIQAALAALSNVGAGNVTVSGKFITFTPAVGAVSLSVAGSFTGGTSPAIYIGNVLIQNTPINQESLATSGSGTVTGYATGQDPATLVLNALASAHNNAGSVGAKINAAGASGDPLANPVPGSYADGTAGNILGKFQFDASNNVYADLRTWLGVAPNALTANKNVPAAFAENSGGLVPMPQTVTGSVANGSLPVLSGQPLYAALDYPFSGVIAVSGINATGWSKILFTVKALPTDTDANAKLTIQVSNPPAGGDGITVLNGGAPVSANDGSITVTEADSGGLNVTVATNARGMAIPLGKYTWELVLFVGGAKQVWFGNGPFIEQATLVAAIA